MSDNSEKRPDLIVAKVAGRRADALDRMIAQWREDAAKLRARAALAVEEAAE